MDAGTAMGMAMAEQQAANAYISELELVGARQKAELVRTKVN